MTGLVILISRPPAGLSPAGMKCLGVAVICFSLWVLQSIPLAATSLLAIVLLPTFNILGHRQVFSFFGNSAVFFLLGVFILSGAIIRTGLSKRLAFLFMNRFGHSPKGLLFGVLFTSALFALFMPEHAVAAMMFPVVMEIAVTLRLEKGISPLGKSLFLALAWGSVIGGIGTYLGGARVPLAVEFLRENYGREINFLSWAAAATPIAVILTVIAYFMLSRFFPSEISDVSSSRSFLASELRRIGKISLPEIKTAVIMIIAILTWITAGHRVGLAVVSIAAAIAVFVLNIANWKDVADYINWGVIVMYGGAIALGKALYETRAIEWVVSHQLDSLRLSPFLLIVILSGLAMLMTEAISNAAAVVILVPLSYGFVAQSGLSPEILTLAVTIPAGLAFCLPVGTPPNAIAYSSGYYSIRDSLMFGTILKFIAWIVFLIVAKFLWPLIGMGF
ncbi:MAG: DASS family sodium-coupled anion symporter [Candidatus Aminicenantes bacterium]|nr:DASS family sodium-coupled anion symporter [Candidatus Aminicenantes bacterium]